MTGVDIIILYSTRNTTTILWAAKASFKAVVTEEEHFTNEVKLGPTELVSFAKNIINQRKLHTENPLFFLLISLYLPNPTHEKQK